MLLQGFFSVTEQVSRHLAAELRRGRWSGKMPGRDRLAKELGVSRKTVELALRLLEDRGLLAAEGAGRRRRIAAMIGDEKPPGLRINILLYEESDRMLPYMTDLLHRLEDAGHVATFAKKTLLSMKRDLNRVADHVERNAADAWIVHAGTREILEWFASRPVPVFALFGRRRQVVIAGGGPDKGPAIREVTRRLGELGHRRVVMLARGERRKPQPGAVEQAFLDELEAQGMVTGAYNLPDWEETPDGYRSCIDRLFGRTPPTAIIFHELLFFNVAQHYLARRGILAPEHVSLVSMDPDPSFAWYRPNIAHIRWDADPLVRRVVSWAGEVGRGKNHRRQIDTKAVFVEGGTVGRA